MKRYLKDDQHSEMRAAAGVEIREEAPARGGKPAMVFRIADEADE